VSRYEEQKDSRDPIISKYLEVTPRKDESPERFVKRFTKKVRNDGILQEVYLRKGYEKPSEKRRRKLVRSRFRRTEQINVTRKHKK
jgi:small subunit ribosomal protein S21